MGDGNHSFATAKAIREEKKKTLSPAERADHPARFALVELVNVHDAGLAFEPIHRVLFDVEHEHLLTEMKTYFQSQGSDLVISDYATKEEMRKTLMESTKEHHYVRFVRA